MTKGFVVLAQNNNEEDYVKMAYALALSLKLSQKEDTPITLITNDSVEENYCKAFDKVVPILWDDAASKSNWKIENRWKIYHASPYDETIVLDADMLVFKDLSAYWNTFSNYNIYFTSKVTDYRGNRVRSDYYRKAFTANGLPDIYTGLHYFKKSDDAKSFYEWLELITNNWELFYGKYVSEFYPGRPSMDVTAALAAKILGCEHLITNYRSDPVTFVHMKPMVQGWKTPTEFWRQAVGVYFDDKCRLKIGNYQQNDIFHYTEKEFLTDQMISQLELTWKQ